MTSTRSRSSLRRRLSRPALRLFAGSGAHRLYSDLNGLVRGRSSGGRTPTEHLQHGLELTDDEIAAGRHRRLVGGRWEEIGRLQLEFLVSEGLEPGHTVLDVGCGALRAGVPLVAYLEPGRYYGIDINPSLVRAGRWELEQAGLADRCPPGNLRATDDFDCDFGVRFDVAVAQSLFTHIPLEAIAACLGRIAATMDPGGRVFASYNGLPPGKRLSRPSTRDPFRHAFDDLAAAGGDDWETRYIDDWGHPRAMRMIEYRRRRTQA